MGTTTTTTWEWLTTLGDSEKWGASCSSHMLELVTASTTSMVLKVERTVESSDGDFTVTFSVGLRSPAKSPSNSVLWVSDPCPLSAQQQQYGSSSSYLRPLLLQLLREVTIRSPTVTSWPTPFIDLSSLPATDAPNFSSFFELVFLCRLFWLCAYDATADVGSLCFQLLKSNIDKALDCKGVVREMLKSAGVDWEVHFMRSVGYMLAKWCILKDISSSSKDVDRLCSFAYATEMSGLWVLRAYAPVLGIGISHRQGQANLEARHPVLRYALAHQQLEAVVQLGYSVQRQDENVLRISVRVDNIRIRVIRLNFGQQDSDDRSVSVSPDERHFPSRIRIQFGPNPSSPTSRHVGGLSLGRSTDNTEKTVEREHNLKGKFSDSNKKTPPKLKASTRTSIKEKLPSWRWEQDAEGNAAVIEGVLCDNSTGEEVATWRPEMQSGGGRSIDPRGGMRRRNSGSGRPFGKSGGLMVAGDDSSDWAVNWRVGKEMEGQSLKWRLGWKVWVSYCPNEINTSYFETRCVEWVEDLELTIPLLSSLR